jgi:osmotically inducible protein OsmC
MMRQSEAHWRGSLSQGAGQLRLGSGAFEGSYSYLSRFENGVGSNPEELIAAAHAGCFSMALAYILGNAGYTPETIDTVARVHVAPTKDGPTITRIELETSARAPPLTSEQIAAYAEEAKKTCLVSRALAAVPDIALKVIP